MQTPIIGQMGPNLFFFLKQSNGDFQIKVNPEYLRDYRFKNNIRTGEEVEAMKRLDEATWRALKTKLRTMTDKEKRSLLKREWGRSYMGDQEILESLDKHYMKEVL